MRWLIGTAYLWVRRQFVSFWLRQLADVPKPVYNVVETSATRAMDKFMLSRPRGTTVFWAVPDAGKTAAVTNCVGRRVLFDWNYCIGENPDDWFCSKIGWPERLGECFGRKFTTVILDHFDRAMNHDSVSAEQLVRRLTVDSTHSGTFNVLVCVSSAEHALALLRTSYWHMSLLGQAYCGQCTVDELKQLDLSPMGMEVGTHSGVIGMAASVRAATDSDDAQYVRAIQAGKLWDEGESLLCSYRMV